MAKNLIYSLTKGVFFIDREFALAQLGAVQEILKHPKIDGYENEVKYSANQLPSIYSQGQLVNVRHDTDYGTFDLLKAPEGSTVAIPVSGALMKDDYCGSPGTATIVQWIQMADRNPNISKIILSIDSPGGDVSGTQNLADAIKACKTPIDAYVNDGYAASAAYWVASACDNIYASHESSRVGSIGVMAVLANWEKHYRESMQLEIHTLYADQSSDKNQDVKVIFDGNDRPYIEGTLNKLAATFISTVKENRAGKLNLSAGNPFTGKMYFASEAIEIGLIDGVKKISDLISSGSSLPQIQSNSNTEMKTLKISSLFAGLLAFFNVSKEEGKAEYEVQASEEQMQDLLKKAESSIQLDAQVKQLTTDLEAAKASITQKDSDIAAKDAEIATLKAAPGSDHAVRPNADIDPNRNLNEGPGNTEVDAEAKRLYAERQKS